MGYWGGKVMDKATLRLVSKISYTLGVIDSRKNEDSKDTLNRVSNALSTALEDFVIESAGERNASN